MQQTEFLHSPKSEFPPRIPPHFIQDKLNLTNSLVRSKLDSINHEILELDHRMQSIQLVNKDKDKRKPPQLPHIPAPPESDTEHIYETIPESVDSELEPIYSCPYEAGQENLIEQWLKAQDNGPDWMPVSETSREARKSKEKDKEKDKTSSKSNSSGEEHENSSSAYNTGGSCNSNPLTFELAASADAKHRNLYR